MKEEKNLAALEDALEHEKLAREVWENNPAHQAEFGNFETFFAFKKAQSKGLVSIIGT
jgi:hypothetical protein